MKKRELEMILQRMPPLSSPEVGLEQYQTPATVAADMLFTAHANGDVQGRRVADLGCGNGMLSIGAWLLGAERVIGVEVSERTIKEARSNVEAMGAEVELVHGDVREFGERVDTVVMNPPFGCQRRGADRPFLEKAMQVADSVYSLHMTGTLDFLDSFVRKRGWRIVLQKAYKYEIPHMFDFHRKEKMPKDVSMIHVRRSQGESS